MREDEIIKSVRLYEENGVMHLDYRVQTTAKLPKGKQGNRFRFSTNKKATKIAMNKMERQKHIFAAEHYYSLFDNLANTEEPLFEDVCYLALGEAEANRRKKDGTKDYLNILERDVLPTFGEMKLRDIRVSHIKAWQVLMGEDKISQSRFNKKFYVLKRILDYSIENEYILSNPITHVKRTSKLFSKAKSNDSEYYTVEEREKLLNDVYDGDNKKTQQNHAFIVAFLHVAFLCGARTGEIMSLKWESVDFESNLITFSTSMRKSVLDVTKMDQVRTVPMVKRLAEALLKYKGNTHSKYVFPIPNKGTPYKDSRTITDHKFKPLLKRLNIPYKILYSTRHTFASLAVEHGVSIPTVSKCLGHNNISTTQRFYVRMGNLDYDKSRAELESIAL